MRPYLTTLEFSYRCGIIRNIAVLMLIGCALQAFFTKLRRDLGSAL